MRSNTYHADGCEGCRGFPTNTDVRGAFRRCRGNAAYPSLESLDAFFCDCLEEVEAGYDTLDRATKIRVERWIEKLNGPYPLPNVAWRKNRNAFAALLAHAIQKDDFREPFDRRPPQGNLPILAAHLRARIPDRTPHRRDGRRFWDTQRAQAEATRGYQGNAPQLAKASQIYQRPSRFAGGNGSTASPSPLPSPSTYESRRGASAVPCHAWGAPSLSPGRAYLTKGIGLQLSPNRRPHTSGEHGTVMINRENNNSSATKDGEEETCRFCGGDPARIIRALESTVKEQGTYIEGLRMYAALTSTQHATMLRQLQRDRLLERDDDQRYRLRIDEELKATRLDDLLGNRPRTTAPVPTNHDEEVRNSNSRERSSSAAGSQRLQEGIGVNIPCERAHGEKDVAGMTEDNVDLDRRLERFQEDARVLVELAKKRFYGRL